MILQLQHDRPPTLADVIERLGDIEPSRIRANPPPGLATEADLLDIHLHERRLYELVDGTLVEKIMGVTESALECDLIKFLGIYLDLHDEGFLLGPDGALRLMPQLVRIPDISFISWKRNGSRQRPTVPIPSLAPDLAVEVLSKGNTPKEMSRKVGEYFSSGAVLVWLVDPRKREVQVFTAPKRSARLTEKDTLHGREVLPGFALPLQQLFAEVPVTKHTTEQSQGAPSKRKKKRLS